MTRILFFCLIFLILFSCSTTSTSRTAPATLNLRVVDEKDDVHPAPADTISEGLAAKPFILLEDLLQIAERSNPEIGARREELDSASDELDLVCASEPEAEHNSPDVFRQKREYSRFSISQPLFGHEDYSAATSGTAADKGSKILKLEQKRREVFGDIYAVFIKLLYVRQVESLYQQLIAEVRDTLKPALRDGSKTLPIAEVKPEVEVENLERSLGTLAGERRSLAQRLKSLLGGVQVPVERIKDELPAELPKIESARLFESLDENPEILAAKKDVEAAELRAKQAKAERLPDVSIVVGGRKDRLAEEYYTAEAGVSLPWPSFDRKRGDIEQAESLAQDSMKVVTTLENKLRADLLAAHAAYLSAQEHVAVSRDKILPAAEKALSETEEGYRAGKRSLLDLLNAQKNLAEARLSYLEELRDWNLADAEIRKIAGFQYHEVPNSGTGG